MHAQKARELTKKALEKPDARAIWMLFLYGRIEAAADGGSFEIKDPFAGEAIPSEPMVKLIYDELRNNGYTVYTGMSAHGYSHRYDIISWRK